MHLEDNVLYKILLVFVSNASLFFYSSVWKLDKKVIFNTKIYNMCKLFSIIEFDLSCTRVNAITKLCKVHLHMVLRIAFDSFNNID